MPIDPNNLSGTAVLTFDDEFNSLSLWNGTSGTWTTTYPFASPTGNGSTLASNGEQEWYVNSNYAPTAAVKPWSVANGALTLTAAPAAAAIQPLIDNYQYTSGQLNTVHSFSQTYGFFEMRAELPAGQGLWPAFWLLPESGAWPPELDVMEVLGNSPTTLYTTVHTASTGTNTQQSLATTVADTSTGFHTYGVDWEPDYVTWYFDGQAIDRVATPSDMNSPMYMLLNLAVGGYWPGDANATTAFPAHMTVDWVRAYQSKAAADPPPVGGDGLTASGAAVTLSQGSGWTSAAVLSTGALAVASGPGAAGVGAVSLFGAGGAATGATRLQAFEGVSPSVTPLAGGFWEVTYAGSSDFEVYGASGQLVFQHNLWSPAGQAFTALQDGDYLVTTPGSNSVGLVDPAGAIDWVSLPSGAPAGAAETVTALDGGGFALAWAGTGRFELFDAAGRRTGSGELGASVSAFATATVATGDGGFAQMWLSADGGQGGLPSTLDVQSFDAQGRATSGVIGISQDLDPWHTQMKLIAAPDGAITALWSQGGQIWSSEIANGAAGPVAATGVTGALSQAEMVALSTGETGFAFLAYGDAWAEVWDPATRTKTVAELGAATGDGSSLHALATAAGGFAVSWHDGSAVEASVVGADGRAGAAMAIAGDLLGVDAAGQAVSVYSNGAGAPMMQAYTLGGGGFWQG